jgi:hypothetical protein
VKVWNAHTLDLVSCIEPETPLKENVTPVSMACISPNICIGFSDGSLAVFFAFSKKYRNGGWKDTMMASFRKSWRADRERRSLSTEMLEKEEDYYDLDYVDSEDDLEFEEEEMNRLSGLRLSKSGRKLRDSFGILPLKNLSKRNTITDRKQVRKKNINFISIFFFPERTSL